MNRPRKHHILPIFYLAGFTDTRTRSGRIHVFDYFRNTRYRANPNQVANEREFYRIYERGYDPYGIERNLAELEKEVAPVLYRVVESGNISRGRRIRGDTLFSCATSCPRSCCSRKALHLNPANNDRENRS